MFFEKTFDNRLYLKSNMIDIPHAFTSKLGGVSKGDIKGLNLGFRVNDNIESVKENYRLVANDMGIDLNKTVLSRQTHTNNIRIISEEDLGKGITKDSDIYDTDGLISNIKGSALIVFSADCTPILFYNKEKQVIAAVHAGWRGSVLKIASKCVELMKENFNCNPEKTYVAMGPSIGPCCFEFGPEAPDIFGEEYVKKAENDKYFVDLWKYNLDILTNCGIPRENIDLSKVCTVCHSDKYYSYRTTKDKTGRQGAIISLG